MHADYHLETGKLIDTLKGHTDKVYAVAFSSDGKTLASGSGDQNIMLWNVASGGCIATIKGGVGETIWSMAFSPDGKTLASSSSDKTIKLWDVSELKKGK